jgi:hypothetical protein
MTYISTIKHDNGTFKLRVTAKDIETAKYLIMSAEGCPERAIIKMKAI